MEEIGRVNEKDLKKGLKLKPNTCVVVDDMGKVLCNDGNGNISVESLEDYRF